MPSLFPNLRLEACVESLSEALNAQSAGADQLEYCSRLDLDGMTPTDAQLVEVRSQVTLPIKVMLRLRPGHFRYNVTERSALVDRAGQLVALGFSDLVFGATNAQGKLDISCIEQVLQVHPSVRLTIHKAIDHCADPVAEIENVKKISQVTGILTSGGADTAWNGRLVLASMLEACPDTLQLIPAGGITSANLGRLHAFLGANIYHGRRIVAS